MDKAFLITHSTKDFELPERERGGGGALIVDGAVNGVTTMPFEFESIINENV